MNQLTMNQRLKILIEHLGFTSVRSFAKHIGEDYPDKLSRLLRDSQAKLGCSSPSLDRASRLNTLECFLLKRSHGGGYALPSCSDYAGRIVWMPWIGSINDTPNIERNNRETIYCYIIS